MKAVVLYATIKARLIKENTAMRKLIKKDSAVITAFAAVYTLLILINVISQLIFDTVILPTMLFSAMVIIWGTTFYRRTLHKKIRRYIIAADVFLFLLFIITVQ